MRVLAQQHDTVDALCYRHLGSTAGVVEQVLELNPSLAAQGPFLPQGTEVVLPDITTTTASAQQALVQLWD
ncbi:tail protein X [Stenotrophomonas sp. MMGLT7]|uniref:tail protein X n=1 Tax=Stenotrophomonas sp. MMGLT7 TaxID=2901227 RepID=UPI001E54A593|nr:tail protein X [Stenotrophomonas sp. MMGLT7]MCD7096993.1 tail protein X [Stenotrophomonas sp. MMGLT7]